MFPTNDVMRLCFDYDATKGSSSANLHARLKEKRNIPRVVLMYIVLTSVSVFNAVTGILCYNCEEAVLPQVCDRITSCGPHETCYVERYVSNTGTVYFNSGCKQFNKTCGSNDKKRTIDPDCVECCSTDYCNKNICSSTPLKPLRRCLQCSGVFSPGDCTKVTTCTDDQLCHTQEVEHFGFTLFSLGCLSKSQCYMEPIFDRRGIVHKRTEKCHQCCRGENCNRDLCTDNTTSQMGSTVSGKSTSLVTTTNKPATLGTNQTTMAVTSTTSYTPLYPRDCLDIYNRNVMRNGVYRIFPAGITSFNVFCDLIGGGWTVIQQRMYGNVNFTRGWSEYVKGFGHLNGDFWLGLDYIHALSNPPVKVKIEGVLKQTNETAWMSYDNFTIDDFTTNYTMHLNKTGTYEGIAVSKRFYDLDGFGYHNNSQFGTFDHRSKGYLNLGSGWWFPIKGWTVSVNGRFDAMNMRGGNENGAVIKSQVKIRRR